MVKELTVECDSCHAEVTEWFYHPEAGNHPLCGTCHELVVELTQRLDELSA
jgi:hypothetical protein